MQRKNRILRNSQKRGGFALIMAISVVVIISTIMAISLSLTTQTSKRTVDLYVYEQVLLLSKSAAEYALLEISQANPCSWPGANFTQDTIYDINITPRYIYSEASVCTTGGQTPYFTISTPEQNGSVLLDITVSVNDVNITNEPIRYFRRTIQKL